jgi:hypothetical protein
LNYLKVSIKSTEFPFVFVTTTMSALRLNIPDRPVDSPPEKQSIRLINDALRDIPFRYAPHGIQLTVDEALQMLRNLHAKNIPTNQEVSQILNQLSRDEMVTISKSSEREGSYTPMSNSNIVSLGLPQSVADGLETHLVLTCRRVRTQTLLEMLLAQ